MLNKIKIEESKGNIKQENTASLNLTKWKSIVFYFQDNLVLIQTNSDHLSSKKTHTHAKFQIPFEWWRSTCIYDIEAMIRTTTENKLKTLITKCLGVETLSYVSVDCSAESLANNDKKIDNQLSRIYDEDWVLWSRKDRSKLTYE